MVNSDHFYSMPLFEDDKLLCELRLAPKMSCIRLVIIIIFIMVRLSPARRSNVQRPHTSARGRQFLMLYSACKSCLRSSANFCALRAMLITA